MFIIKVRKTKEGEVGVGCLIALAFSKPSLSIKSSTKRERDDIKTIILVRPTN